MYIPEFNRVRDLADAVSFVQANPFAILISPSEGGPFATHIPILAREADNQVVLHGHMAKANSHWGLLEGGQESLIIFHGPHAYISPSLYESRESVPTWNYATVHVYGEPTLFTDEESLRATLHRMIDTFESSYMAQWSELSEQYQSRMMKHIVGFDIKVKRLEAKFKLSQNRTKGEQAQVIQSLNQSEDSNVSGVAHLMQQEDLGH